MPLTNLVLAIIVVASVAGYDIAHTETIVMADEPKEVVETPVASPSASPTPIPTDIVGYINYKFGDDAWKAFKVLQGDECHENLTLNPEALNDNTWWGGVGRDRGYWQINDIYHPEVSNWCASDVKCSTDYAYKLYKARGYNFSAWTCGKFYSL